MAFAFESEEDLFPIYEDTKTPFFDKVGGEESLFSYDVADESREFIEQDERSLNHFVFVKEEDAHSFFPVKEEMPQQPSPPRQPSPTTNQFYSLKEEFPQPPQQAYANLSPTGSPRNFGSQNIYTLQVPQIHAHQGTGGRRFSNPPMYTLGNFSNVTLPQPQIQQVQQQYQPQSPQISPQIAPQFQFQTSPIQPFSPQNHHFQQEFQPVQFSRYNKDYDVRGYTNDHSGSSLSYSSSGTYSTEEDSSHTEEPNFCDDYEQSDEQKIIEIASKFTLPSSKSPIIEAMIFCAVHNWGIFFPYCLLLSSIFIEFNRNSHHP